MSDLAFEDLAFEILLSNGDAAKAETVEDAFYAAYHLQTEGRVARKLGGYTYPSVIIKFEGQVVLDTNQRIDVRQVYTYEPRVAHLKREAV